LIFKQFLSLIEFKHVSNKLMLFGIATDDGKNTKSRGRLVWLARSVPITKEIHVFNKQQTIVEKCQKNVYFCVVKKSKIKLIIAHGSKNYYEKKKTQKY